MDKNSASYVYVKDEPFAQIMHQVLKNKEVSEANRNDLIESLIMTSLRGVDSHGINLFPHYCNMYDSGRMNNKPNIQIESLAASTIKVNADYAIGHHAGSVAMKETIALAKKNGIACAGVYNSNHFGAAAYFGLQAAQQDCIGFAFTNGDALTKAFAAKKFYFGTNPICFTAPMRDEEPFCLDMATSLVSYNKIKNYRLSGGLIPDHWAYDEDGQPVTDPNEASSLSPIGDYKGFGLGMMIEIMCALLMNSVTGKDMLPMFTSPVEAKRYVSHFFMVIDISKFLPIDTFKANLQEMANDIRQMERLQNNVPIQVAGDPEKITFKQRKKEGIPVLNNVFDKFLKIDGSFGKAKI